ncbi:hypothetical protein TRFO_07012 [Tritrichomonas foetus]|uniref:Uncharacterized protein n=1 Tax=Tritrichomonas foetus TaxID=1144522 RepID=A0A1J4JV67_9EUKA|nr:hypothetical protein TRFO_07012 [Tritrichomonas foetus]|eukprot:OHT02602.1 hypothetical protein TRFO_07012 [Tritrichomonas foetus]
MTWAQSSGRNFNFSQSSTPARVSPCSYTIESAPPAKPKKKRDNKSFRPRETLPPPDFITPGPGSYDDSKTFITSTSRPESSFFLSRSIRNTYFSNSQGKAIPSSADHGRITEWGQRKPITQLPHHPKKYKREIKKEQTCNYLDDQGRMIYVKEEKHDPEDIGPGSYDQDVYSNSRACIMCVNPRSTGENWARKTDAPSPDTYVVEYSDSRLPVSIKGAYDSKNKSYVIDALTNPPKDKIVKRPNSVFLSRVPRDIFEAPKDKIPGPDEHSQLDYGKKKPHIYKGLAFGSKAVRTDRPNITPGPADYHIQSPKRQSTMTSQFVSRSQKKPLLESTPENVGPGSYNLRREQKIKPQQSPAFIDGIKREGNDDNGNPSPDAYTLRYKKDIDATFINTRYPKKGDWIYESMSEAPSPEKYNVERSLGGPSYAFPKTKENKTRKKDPIGPGTYETNTSSVIHRSYNSAVPKYG